MEMVLSIWFIITAGMTFICGMLYLEDVICPRTAMSYILLWPILIPTIVLIHSFKMLYKEVMK